MLPEQTASGILTQTDARPPFARHGRNEMSARLSHRLRKPAAPWRPMTLALAAALLAVAAVMTVTMTMTTISRMKLTGCWARR